jgi:hypothetical protein
VFVAWGFRLTVRSVLPLLCIYLVRIIPTVNINFLSKQTDWSFIMKYVFCDVGNKL